MAPIIKRINFASTEISFERNEFTSTTSTFMSIASTIETQKKYQRLYFSRVKSLLNASFCSLFGTAFFLSSVQTYRDNHQLVSMLVKMKPQIAFTRVIQVRLMMPAMNIRSHADRTLLNPSTTNACRAWSMDPLGMLKNERIRVVPIRAIAQ
jgi:hypothetical protein